MGIGDEIMEAGRAEELAIATGRRVCIVDQRGRARWSEVWENNPHISRQPERGSKTLIGCSGARAYIRYPFTRQSGITFTGWRSRDHRGHLYLTDAERAQWTPIIDRLGRYIVIEPYAKPLPAGNPNKQWPRERYAQVAERAGIKVVQLGPQGTQLLPSVDMIVVTPTFRAACVFIERAAAYVGTEGGLHHAAAALGVPAVVIFGGSPSIEATGYPEHENLGVADPCGQWLPCAHCARSLDAITVDQVLDALSRQTAQRRAA